MKLYVYEARMNANMTLKELSNNSGVAKSYIQKLEDKNSFANPSLRVMCKLAKALNVDMKSLFTCDE